MISGMGHVRPKGCLEPESTSDGGDPNLVTRFWMI